MADETTRGTAQDDLEIAPGMAEGAAHDGLGSDDARAGDGVPVGSADADADRVRSGVDADAVGDQGARTAGEALLGDDALDDGPLSDEGESVGLADRDADVERTT